MDNNKNNNFIDVESSPVDEGQQVAWKNCFEDENYIYNKKKKKKGIRMLGKVAGLLIITMVGGLFGSGITYSLMKKIYHLFILKK